MNNDIEKKQSSRYWKKLPPFFQGHILRDIAGGLVLLLTSIFPENSLGNFGCGFFALGLICATYCAGAAGATFCRAHKKDYIHYGGICVKAESAKGAHRILLIRRKAAVQKVTLRFSDDSTVDLKCPGERPFLEGGYYRLLFQQGDGA